MVIPSIANDSAVKRLSERLAASRGVVHVSGLWGSSAPMVTAFATAAHPRILLYITSHLAEADQARDDLEMFLGRPCALFPAWEALPGEGPASGEIQAERLLLCSRLLDARRSVRGAKSRPASTPKPPQTTVAPFQPLWPGVPTARALERNSVHLVVQGSDAASTAAHGVKNSDRGLVVRSPQALVAWAVDRGFARLELVESPGDVAQRGDIVDLFAPGETTPCRVQFFGEQVESIRRFDVSSQRSIETLDSLSIAAMPDGASRRDDALTNFLSYLPEDALIVIDNPSEVQEMGETLSSR